MRLRDRLDDALIQLSRRPEELRDGVTIDHLPPRLWEQLRIQLQAEYRRATGESDAALVVLDAQAGYRHKKRGTEYVLIGLGKMQAETWVEPVGAPIISVASVDMREVAMYRSVEDGSLWVCPRDEFEDGRSEAIAGASAPPSHAALHERVRELEEALRMALPYMEARVNDYGGIDNCEIDDRLAYERALDVLGDSNG